jgi:hypothetical protein
MQIVQRNNEVGNASTSMFFGSHRIVLEEQEQKGKKDFLNDGEHFLCFFGSRHDLLE